MSLKTMEASEVFTANDPAIWYNNSADNRTRLHDEQDEHGAQSGIWPSGWYYGWCDDAMGPFDSEDAARDAAERGITRKPKKVVA